MVILLRIDRTILDASGVICDNIAQFGSTERGLLSQNILVHIRNVGEYITTPEVSVPLPGRQGWLRATHAQIL